ncbi:Glutamate--tRNA ligase [uncultured archaeon]|nr:Glutamate--tRNA ligase [uncultured archaeon]
MALAGIIRKHALKNAFDYGKANPGSIVGKVIAEFPDSKNDMKGTMKLISGEVSKVNSMGKEEIEKELKNYTFAEKKVEEKKLVLPNAVEGKVITRFPPEPSGYPHIGHAKAAFLDYESAKAYNGKMILRFDDTNPEKESAEYVDAIKDGLKWLGISWDGKESYTSDSMQLFYQYAEKAIEKGFIYICTCPQEQISENREKQKPCACRALGKEEMLARWKKMHSGFRQGEAIVRLKGDLSSLNTVMRDPTLLRIIDAEHYRQGKKYRVWPTYDFVAPIMDSTEGVTHAMRSKEYELRDELYFKMIELLELRRPELVGFSRLAIKNAPISKRLITPLVKEGKVMGWDDPRLPTLRGLARRGIVPEAIKNFVMSFGLSKVESEPGWEKLLSENRKLLEPGAKHYFFVTEPVKIMIKGAKPMVAELKLHPNQNLGTRRISVSDHVYISKTDFEKIAEGETFRLKDLYNVKMLSKSGHEVEYSGDGMVEKKLQWVTDYIETEVLRPGDLLKEDESFNENSLETVKGYAEKNVEAVREGDLIQFERFGFCRLDSKGKNYVFIYSC